MTDLNWFGWILVAFFIVQVVVSIYLVGKEREPLEPSAAVWVFLINMAFIAGILFVGVQ